MGDHVGNVLVTGEQVRVPRMLVEIALRLVDRDLRQLALINGLDQLVIVVCVDVVEVGSWALEIL